MTIGSNVESIGSYAFSGCSNLAEINYNAAAVADLTSSSYVFYNVRSNSEGCTVTFGESVTSIPAYLFRYANITSVAIGSNVESIGSSAFENCSNLASVTIGEGVTSIGSSAFWNCSNLTEITIPASVSSIGDEAFYRCSNLASVTIGEGVTSISWRAFYGCSNLTEINYNAAAVADCDSGVFNGAGSNSGGITVTFGESVTSIPSYLFYATHSSESPNIISVTIGSNVESIGSSAFSRCMKLIEVFNQSALDIAAGSSDHGSVAYHAKNIYTQEGGSWFTNTAEGYRFFYDGSNGYLMGYSGTETALMLPAGFTAYDGTEVTEYEIYTYAFYNYNSLKSVAISSCVTNIGSSAFWNCSNLASVTIRAGVTSIGSSAFAHCSNLTEITIPESVTSIGSSAFAHCSNLTEITIPERVTSIGSSAFYGCSNLTEINYNAVAVADLSYNSNVFYNAGSDSDGITVTFGENVTSIPAYLFYGDYNGSANIVSVTIGSNVEGIGSYAFRGCTNLTEINYNAAAVADLTSDSNVFYNAGSRQAFLPICSIQARRLMLRTLSA